MSPSIEKFPRELELVPNQAMQQLRMAQWWRNQHPRPAAFPAPPVQILSQWVRQVVTRSALLAGEALPQAPGQVASLRLWEAAMQADTADWMPAERRALARRAVEAERLLQHWHDGESTPGGVAWNRFLRWRVAVDAQSRKLGWCTHEWHLRRLILQLDEARVPRACLPERLCLQGFIEETRLEQALYATLALAGVAIERSNSGAPAGQVEALAFDSLDGELRAAAAWAAGKVADGRSCVAVVVNELDAIHEQVRHAFEDALQPAAMLGMRAPGDSSFRISAAPPLAAQPLVASALLLLRLSLGGLRQHQEFALLSRLLLDPAWQGADSERFARALLEHELRTRGEARPSLARVLDLADPQTCPMLHKLLARLPTARSGLGAAAQFRAWLQHWGWPGPVALDALAVRNLQRFAHCLEALEFAAVPTGIDAWQALREACQLDRQEQAGGALSPIQVISPELAAGLRFDAAWLCNFTDRNWPGAVHRNGLLSAAVQAAIPRANPAGRLAFTRRVSEQLLACAGQLRWSWSLAERGVPQGASPLLPPGAAAQPREDLPAPLAWRVYPGAKALAGYRGHPWLRAETARPGRPISTHGPRFEGAVAALELQSACPFAAYLGHRLQARFEPPPEPFASPAYTGHLVHRALEALYRPCIGTDRQPDPTGVSPAVARALRDAHAEQRLLPAALSAEHQRLEVLLCEWLESEGQRQPGRLLDLEHTLEVDWAGLHWRVRMDRLEEQADGRVLVMDYKTGRIDGLRWQQPRLGILQLPLYATLLAAAEGPGPGGVALLSLRQGDMKRKGLSADPALGAAGISAFEQPFGPFRDWQETLAAWQGWLESLAGEFHAGACDLQLHDEAALRYTGLEPLLRLPERLAFLQEAAIHD